MTPVLKYTVLRLALFVAAFGVVARLGAGLPLALVLGALISMMLSYVLLRGPRDELAQRIYDRTQARLGSAPEPRPGGFADKIGRDAALEDAADEAMRRQGLPGEAKGGGSGTPGRGPHPDSASPTASSTP